MVPWKSGNLLVRDTTCYVVAKVKYSYLEGHPGIYVLHPTAFETSGVLGPLSAERTRPQAITHNYMQKLQLPFHHLSMAIQRGHASSIRGISSSGFLGSFVSGIYTFFFLCTKMHKHGQCLKTNLLPQTQNFTLQPTHTPFHTAKATLSPCPLQAKQGGARL